MPTVTQEIAMRRYVQVSGAFFSVLAALQLTRAVMRWPIRVADITVPVWASGVAVVIATTFALWAWRVAKDAA